MKDTTTQAASLSPRRLLKSSQPVWEKGDAHFSKSGKWSCNARPTDVQNRVESPSFLLSSLLESYSNRITKKTFCQQQSMTETKNKRIWAHIEKYQQDNDLKDCEMAEVLGISKQHFSQIKTGRKGIGPKLTARISAKLSIPEGDLLEPPIPINTQEEQAVQFYREQIRALTETVQRLLDIIEGRASRPLQHRAESQQEKN